MKRAAKALSRLWTGIKRLYQRAGFYMLLAGCLAVVGISAHALRSRPPYVPRPMQQADSQKGFAQRLSEAAVPTACPRLCPQLRPRLCPRLCPVRRLSRWILSGRWRANRLGNFPGMG